MEKFETSFTPKWGALQWLMIAGIVILAAAAAEIWFGSFLFGFVESWLASVPGSAVFVRPVRLMLTLVCVAGAIGTIILLTQWKMHQVKRFVSDMSATKYPLDEPENWAVVMDAKPSSIDFRLARKGTGTVCFPKAEFRARAGDSSFQILPGPVVEIAGTERQQAQLRLKK